MGYIAVIIAQTLYSASDAWKKIILNVDGFGAQTLLKPHFLLAILIGGVGFIFQMYALSKMDLSRTIITMGMLAIIFSAGIGILYFHDRFTTLNSIGVGLALIAIILVNLK